MAAYNIASSQLDAERLFPLGRKIIVLQPYYKVRCGLGIFFLLTNAGEGEGQRQL